jgi:murein DD-endopeptidase MepM/ murein hydrolase activator NlpD
MLPFGHLQFCARRLGRLWGVGLVLLALGAGADETYTVKPKDTLYNLARQQGISVAQLADRNGLSRNAHLYVGQRLIIPAKYSAPPVAQPALNSSVQKSIDSARVAPGRWKYIVIHHSGVDEGTMKSMDRYHREERHMENGLAYHFVIGNGNGMGDGEIGVGQRWREQLNGGHLASEKQNTYCLGICLVGNFDRTKPTAKQMQNLTALTQALMKRCNLTSSTVRTHQQINVVRTRCPGRYFPTQTFLNGLKVAS